MRWGWKGAHRGSLRERGREWRKGMVQGRKGRVVVAEGYRSGRGRE